jgi:hypothetical protein
MGQGLFCVLGGQLDGEYQLLVQEAEQGPSWTRYSLSSQSIHTILQDMTDSSNG